jgi:hypothetical protein
MALPQHYEQLIDQITSLCPPPDKFAHLTAGLLFWLVGSLLMRKPLYSRWPLALIVALEVANEYMDFLAHHSWRWPDTLGDAAATWFWPFVLSFCMARWPRLRSGKA